MRVSIPDPILERLSEVNIIRPEFTLEWLEMEQEFKRLQEITEKSEENARVHKHKARKMIEGYTKVKGDNENLY